MSLAHSTTRFAFAVLALASAHAQTPCVEWSAQFGAPGLPGFQAQVLDTAVFDDGTGPALYACGTFVVAVGADPAYTNYDIVRWNGADWIPLGAGSPVGTVRALEVFDDGSGPALYAGGEFNYIGLVNARNIAKWDGSTWQPLASGFRYEIYDLLAFDDGNGSKLYVGGDVAAPSGGGFDAVLGTWDGSSWDLVGGADVYPTVEALVSYDDGSGPALYVAGAITSVVSTGLSPHNIARWNGSVWSTLGNGVTGGRALALAVHDDGLGAKLYVGGNFHVADGNPGVRRIACWDGAAWSALSTGMDARVNALASFDDGVSSQLYAGGEFVTAGGTTCNGIARWNGSSWNALGAPAGVTSTLGGTGQVHSLTVFDDGGGDALFAGGSFVLAGAIDAHQIARWDAAGWSSTKAGGGLANRATAFGSFDAGAGRELFVASDFPQPGAGGTHGVARMNPSSGSLTNTVPVTGHVSAFHEHDDGSGNALYAAGQFTSIGGVTASNVARWDGSQWSPLGNGVGGSASDVHAMASYDDGGGVALWIAGRFVSAGGAPAQRVARWDGTTWFAPATGPNGEVFALAVFDDGSGDELYATGNFTNVGSQVVNGIAKWNGTTWSPVGQGFMSGTASGWGRALQVFDDGSGAKLYAGGSFFSAPPAAASGIARWDGLAWQTVGSGFNTNGGVYSLAVFAGGSSPELVAGGGFSHAGSTLIRRLARWTGTDWLELADGTDSFIDELYVFDDGSFAGPRLIAGGMFALAGDTLSLQIAVLERACPCAQTYCVAGTSVNGCVPAISATGIPSAAGGGAFVVNVDDLDGQRAGLIFYGVNGAANSPWGATSSTLCVKAPQQRTGQQSTAGTAGACDGALTLDWDAYVAANPTALGMPLQAGTSVSMQGWYRDPANAKTTGLSDALEFLVCP